ncbi:MAG: metal dependent phosphohydrolase [Gammaproteobacteria bacterium]|nr:MAG: metal dependent phosphohydrolase [Gammaproteobacteria bacterium]TND01752.1 MAG: metal dependent phosphohydrolase [Gammaproteobacteria bacterium]
MRIDVDRPLLKSLLLIGAVVEARDAYTGGRLWRVSRFSRLLAEQAGLSGDEIARISVGGFLHDLGKVGVPDAIVNKPARLTNDEYDIIKTHPAIGEGRIAEHPLAVLAQDAIRHHHERVDGGGIRIDLARPKFRWKRALCRLRTFLTR